MLIRCIKLGQKCPREASPILIFQTRDIFNILCIKSIAVISEPFAKQLLIITEYPNMRYHILDHCGIVCFIKYLFKIMTRFQLGFYRIVDTGYLVTRLYQAMPDKIILDPALCHLRIRYDKHILEYPLLNIDGKRIAVYAYRIDLIQNSIFTVQKRIARKNIFTGICTFSGQSNHKLVCARLCINNMLKIPRCYFLIGTNDPRIRRFFIKRTDVIRNPEIEQLNYLLRYGQSVRVGLGQKSEIFRCIVEYLFQFNKMQLLRNNAVIRSAQLWQKLIVLYLLPKLRILGMLLHRIKLFLQILAEFLLRACMLGAAMIISTV